MERSNSFFFLYCCAGWGYIVAFKRFLQCIKYITVEFSPSPALLPPSLRFLEQFQQVSFCTCIHVCTLVAPYFILLLLSPGLPTPETILKRCQVLKFVTSYLH
jgi:hypothetical protein